jgi:hypothetical protein
MASDQFPVGIGLARAQTPGRSSGGARDQADRFQGAEAKAAAGVEGAAGGTGGWIGVVAAAGAAGLGYATTTPRSSSR